MWHTLHLNNSYLSTPKSGTSSEYLSRFIQLILLLTQKYQKKLSTQGKCPTPVHLSKNSKGKEEIHHACLWGSRVFKPNKKLDFCLLSCALLTSSLMNLQTLLRNSEWSCHKSTGHPGERELRGNWGPEVIQAGQLALSFCFLRLDTSVIYQRVPGKDNVLGGDGELSWRPVTKHLSSCFAGCN